MLFLWTRGKGLGGRGKSLLPRWLLFCPSARPVATPQAVVSSPVFAGLNLPAALLTSGWSLWGGHCGVWSTSLASHFVPRAPPVVTTSGVPSITPPSLGVASPQGRALPLDFGFPTGRACGDSFP